MSAFTDHSEPKVLDLFFRGTAWSAKPSTLYFGALTAAPTDTTAGTEVSGGGYSRASLACNTTNWNKIIILGNPIYNLVAVAFPKATANYGTVTHVGIYDAASGGNLLAYRALTTPKTVNTNDTLSFAAGTLSFGFSSSSAIGHYLAAKFFNWFFCGETFPTIASHYIAMCAAAAANSITTEAIGGTYDRITVANNSTSYSAGSATATPQKSNSIAFDFPTADATSWGGPFNDFAVCAEARMRTSISSANTGTEEITTSAAHGLALNDVVVFTGSAPTGLTADGATEYYVINVGSSTTFKVSATFGGSAVNITVTGTGNVYRVKQATAFTTNFAGDTSTINATAHGLSDGDTVRLHTTAADLPNGLSTGTDYYVRDAGTNSFKLAASAGGAAVTFSDDGTGTHGVIRQNPHVLWFGSLGTALTPANTNTPGWAAAAFKLNMD